MDTSNETKNIGSTTNQHNFDIFKRMMELKDLWETHRKDLGLPVNSNVSPDSSENEESSNVDIENITQNKKKPSMSVYKESPMQLQVTTKGIIERNGGSCHLETIVEHIKMRWQKEGVVKSDGSPYGHADCKKAVQSCFRSKINNRPIFTKEKDNEGYWTITPSFEDEMLPDDDLKPLWSIIENFIEYHGGSCSLDDIYRYVHQNWIFNSLSDGQDYPDYEVECHIRVTLNTNPKFMEDPENPDYYQLVNGKKKRKTNGLYKDYEKFSDKTNGHSSRRRKEKEKDEDDELFLGTSLSTSRFGNTKTQRRGIRSIAGESPPPGYTCRCGATDPGRYAKWKRGPAGGEFFCNSCINQWNRKQACPVCGKVYNIKKNNNDNCEANDNDGDEDSNPWIRCDDCHRWVMAKCDMGFIKDLSWYDDSNPNHLHYSCPVCRGDLPVHASNQIKENQNHTPLSHLQSNSNKGKRKREEICESDSNNSMISEEDDSWFEELQYMPQGKIEYAEKQLINKINKSMAHNVNMHPSELHDKLKNTEFNLADEISQYSNQLIGKRNRDQYKRQIELERQIKRMKEEKEKMDDHIELELANELREYYKTQKREYEKQKSTILKSYSKHKGSQKDESVVSVCNTRTPEKGPQCTREAPSPIGNGVYRNKLHCPRVTGRTRTDFLEIDELFPEFGT